MVFLLLDSTKIVSFVKLFLFFNKVQNLCQTIQYEQELNNKIGRLFEMV